MTADVTLTRSDSHQHAEVSRRISSYLRNQSSPRSPPPPMTIYCWASMYSMWRRAVTTGWISVPLPQGGSSHSDRHEDVLSSSLLRCQHHKHTEFWGDPLLRCGWFVGHAPGILSDHSSKNKTKPNKKRTKRSTPKAGNRRRISACRKIKTRQCKTKCIIVQSVCCSLDQNNPSTLPPPHPPVVTPQSPRRESINIYLYTYNTI